MTMKKCSSLFGRRVFHYRIESTNQDFVATSRFMAFIMRCILVYKGYNFRLIGSYPYKEWLAIRSHERKIKQEKAEATFKMKAKQFGLDDMDS